MDHRDHVRLIREGVLADGKIWADLGSGEGAFTLALADLLGPTGSIHTVDRDGRALGVQVRALRDAFPNVSVAPLIADFTMPLELPPLGGIVMANSFHFERDKLAVLRLVRGHLRPGGSPDPRRIQLRPRQPMGSLPALVQLLGHGGGGGRLPRDAAAGVGPEPVPRVDLLGPQLPVGGSAPRDGRAGGLPSTPLDACSASDH